MKGVLVGEGEHHGIGLDGGQKKDKEVTLPWWGSELGPALPVRDQGSSQATATGLSLAQKNTPTKCFR